MHIAPLRSLHNPHFDAPPPLALYVHIPWCVRKCPYCDFNSHEAREGIPEDAYIEALTRDLETALPQVWGRRVHTIFFGGGTPSLLSADALDRLLTILRTLLPVEPLAEITLEANPGTFEIEKFRGFRAAGVNRLSIGIQSFNPAHLKSLGRIHDEREARRAVEIALETFDNVNLDLMYALPEQSIEQALADIDAAIGYGVQHLSAYHLTLEPNTLFHAHPPPLPDDDTAATMQIEIEARLAESGYEHYETSAFAQKHHACLHNLNYWHFGDYLGIGAGAHSKLTATDRVTRSMRHKQPKAYMTQALAGSAVQEQHDIAAQEMGFEFMMNALRLNAGFPLALFQARTGLPLNVIERPLQAAEARGLIARDLTHIRPTPLGQRFLNDLLEIFLQPPK
ncbi:MAG: oxygen-independent coproporphyrinogen III oxidase-like protein [Hydrogenophilales bacterium]|nr:oxygen-independent coproporphyrinogen III oxidase-like protein [Hydrogenophilales bacterium]